MTTAYRFPGVTGSPVHTMQVTAALREAGNETYVVRYAGWRGLRPRVERWQGISAYSVPLVAMLPTLVWLQIRHRPAIVHAHGLLGAKIGALAGTIGRCPVVVEWHNVEIPDDVNGHLSRGRRAAHRVLDAVVRRKVAGMIVLSEVERTRAERLRWVDATAIEVIYPSIAPDFLDDRAPRPMPEHGPVVGYAGNFMTWQGVELLLDALPAVWERRPDVRVQLLGASDEDRERLTPHIPVDDRLEIHGRVDLAEMPAILRAMDVLVIPRPVSALSDTTGRKLGEYLASGRVVVATDVGDHRRLLSAGDAGVVVEPSPAGIARGVLDALDDPARYAQRAQNGVRLARERFGLDTSTSQRLELFDAVEPAPSRFQPLISNGATTR